MINYAKYLLIFFLIFNARVMAMCPPCALMNALGSPYTLGVTGGAAFSPTSNCLAVVINDASEIVMFSVDPLTCQLTQAGVPVSTGGSSPFFVAISPDGSCLAVANQSTSTIALFSINPLTCQITAVGAPVNSGGTGPAGIAFSPNGSCLAVANLGSDNLALFGVNNCVLSGPATFAFPAGTSPVFVAFSPILCSGQYLLVVSHLGAVVNNLSRFNIDPATCAITSLGDFKLRRYWTTLYFVFCKWLSCSAQRRLR